MNREETIAAIKVMQAFVDGAEIEVSPRHSDEWVASGPDWSWKVCDYRIKPKPLELWVGMDCGGVSVFETLKQAQCNAPHPSAIKHMREVTE